MSLPLAAALGLLLFGAGAKEVRRFERLAAADIAAHLQGPHKAVSVRIELGSLRPGHLRLVVIEAEHFQTPTLPFWTEPQRSQEGRIDRLSIRLKDFEIGGLPIQSLDIELKDCRWDVAYAVREGRIRLSRSTVGAFTARVDEAGVRQFLARRYPFLKVRLLRIDPYKVLLEGDLTTPLGETPFEVVARAKLWRSSGMSLEPAYLTFGGKRISAAENPALGRLLSPVIDLDRDFGLRGALAIRELKLADGAILLSGAATIPTAEPTRRGSP